MVKSNFDKYLYRNYIFLIAGFAIICCLMSGNLNQYMYASVALLCVGFLLRLSVSTIVNNKCTTFQMWIILTWGYILINGFFVTEQYFGWKSILVYLLPALAIMLFYAPFRDKDLIFDIFCKGCEFGAVISIIYIVINELPTILAGGARIGCSASGNVNTVAMNLSVFALVIYYEILFEQKKKVWPLFVICALFILLTGSKKGLMGIALAIILLSIFKYKWRAYKYVLPILLIGIILYILKNSPYFYSIIGRRINAFIVSLETDQTNGSTGERIGMYEIGWQIFKQSPIFGNGYGYFANNTIYGTYSHNNYIEMLVSFGLLGTGLYYSLFVQLIICGLKKVAKDYHIILFICLIFMQISFDFASINYYDNAMMYVVLFFASKIVFS